LPKIYEQIKNNPSLSRKTKSQMCKIAASAAKLVNCILLHA